jgi:hypothetical protein
MIRFHQTKGDDPQSSSLEALHAQNLSWKCKSREDENYLNYSFNVLRIYPAAFPQKKHNHHIHIEVIKAPPI